MSRRFLLLCAATLAAGQTVEPVYRTGTQLVQVDVEVRTDKGPVRGLTKDDFTIQDKGKPQTIGFFSANESGAAAPKADPLPPGVVSNRINANGEGSRNATVILFDRLNIIEPQGSTSSSSTSGGAFNGLAAGAQARAGRQLLELLASLKSTQRVGLYSLFQDLTVVHDFAEDSAPLIESAKRLLANPPAAAPTPEGQALDKRLKDALTAANPLEHSVRAEITQNAFRGIARRLDGVSGSKTLIWVVSSFPLTYGNDSVRRGNDEAEVNAVANELSEANIALYAVDPRGAGTGLGQGGGNASSDTPQEGRAMNRKGGQLSQLDSATQNSENTLAGPQAMEMIANQTGGKSYISINDIAQPIREIVDSSEVSYTLGFYVDSKSLDNKKHDLSIKLSKKAETGGAKATYRKSYLATAHRDKPEMKELIADRLDANRIGVMGVALPAPDRPGVDAVQVRVDLKDLQFERRADKWVASFDLALAIEAGGEPKVAVSPNTLSLTDEQLKQGLAGGVDINNTIPAPDKAATLRVVVLDSSNGEAGSIRVPLPGK